MKIYVNDQFCGAGKTTSAIEYIKNNQQFSYIFVTPYLDEIDRIMENCPDFKQPISVFDKKKKVKNKTIDFINLIKQEQNVVTSHSLLQNVMNDAEAIECLSRQNRVLILDEVMDVVDLMNLRKDTLLVLKNEGCITSDEKTGLLKLIKRIDSSDDFDEIFNLIESGIVYEINNQLIIWTLPIDLFKHMNKIIILTYGYQYQIMAKFFKLHNIETLYVDNSYDFESASETPPIISGKEYIELINIYEGKLNSLGDKKTAMSKAWFNSQKATGGTVLKQLKNNITNLKKNIWKCNNDNKIEICNVKRMNILWTVFSDYKKYCEPESLGNNFIPCNIRATNDYRNVTNICYCVNTFYNPLIVQWFNKMGVKSTAEEEDKFALIEMIQYLYRSAIRENKKTNCYIPSSRMRNLLKDWLNN